MTPVFQKMNLKAQSEIVVLNAPESFEPELAALQGVRVLRSLEDCTAVDFFLAFVTHQEDLDRLAKAAAAKARGDALLWFAYPKASSKRYRCEFNRDSGWTALGEAGYEPVRQVAIDEDWSALRFRRVEFIKKLTRSSLGAISQASQQQIAAREKDTIA